MSIKILVRPFPLSKITWVLHFFVLCIFIKRSFNCRSKI